MKRYDYYYCWACWLEGRGVLLGERRGEEGTWAGMGPRPAPAVGELEMLEIRPWSFTTG